MKKKRIEQDSLGEKEVPSPAYYGIQTVRAVENFPISGLKAREVFVRATAIIKKAGALTNMELGLLPAEIGLKIVEASDEVISGRFDDQFVVDIYQAGAGTSHNMNMNEVLANRAIELLGGCKGDYSICHPNDHVNMSQSTNDVYPTAMRIAVLLLSDGLLSGIRRLSSTMMGKGAEFDEVIKSGRTHLQDATPVTLGQEFHAYGECLERHARSITAAVDSLRELGIGGTAVGTGLNSHPMYRDRVIAHLSEETGLDLVPSPDYFESMQSMRPFTAISSALRDLSVDLMRIANDIRLLASGPTSGLREIILPAVQPGSSIMPGKINPVMAEMLNMVCCQVIGNDLTITIAAQAGQLELNVMMPVISHNLIFSIEILTNALRAFTEKCAHGIAADRERCMRYIDLNPSLVTALSPHIGYLKASEVARKSLETGKPIRDIMMETGAMDRAEIEKILNVRAMTRPGVPGKGEVEDR